MGANVGPDRKTNHDAGSCLVVLTGRLIVIVLMGLFLKSVTD